MARVLLIRKPGREYSHPMRMHGGVNATTVRDRSVLSPGEIEENFARRIAWEMEQRGWSQERLAREMTNAGVRIHQSAISKIIKPRPGGKRRVISIGEAVAFARVFGMDLEEMFDPLLDGKVDELRLLLIQITILYKQMNDAWTGAREYLPRLYQLFEETDTRHAFYEWVDSLPPEEKEKFDDIIKTARAQFPELISEVHANVGKPDLGLGLRYGQHGDDK
jgi:transcriptional regulator with XRE-family HTH domain